MTRKSSRRTLSASERALWHSVIRDAAPLAGRSLPPPEPAPMLPATAPTTADAPPVARVAPATQPAGGLDRRSADRLRRGMRPIEARLDLHGMTQEAAHRALSRFILAGVADRLRTVLVITGKGARVDPSGGSGRGVLRRAVPLWLEEPALAAHILATAPARPQHGGDGALYVLLRRNRA